MTEPTINPEVVYDEDALPFDGSEVQDAVLPIEEEDSDEA